VRNWFRASSPLETEEGTKVIFNDRFLPDVQKFDTPFGNLADRRERGPLSAPATLFIYDIEPGRRNDP
jgi:hypothetical protein